MQISFEDMTLTGKDKRLLKKIKSNPNVLIPCERAERLLRYGLIDFNPIFEKTDDLSGIAQFDLSETGIAYLEWTAKHTRTNIANIIKWVLVTVIAAAVVWVVDVFLDLNFYETIKSILEKKS